MTNINFCSLPFLDSNYNNVIDFENITNQTNYFNGKILLTKQGNIKEDSSQTQITVNTSFNSIIDYDYLFFQNDNGKYYYYFIVDKRQMTSNTVEILVTLDVYSTYLFNHTLNDSFVDRCHVNRWNGNIPTKETIDEGLPLGEYEMYSDEIICEYGYGMLASSTTPLGKIEYTPPNGGGGSTGEPTDGNLSKNGFRFLKGYEGFSPYGLFHSGESFRTGGYGVTELYNKQYYDMLKPFPCSEKLASEILYQRIHTGFGMQVWDLCSKHNIQNKITTNQFNAMVSLAYNRGFGGFSNDSTSPWQIIKDTPHAFDSIRAKWKSYAITSNGNILEGLKLRRIAESNIYCDNQYEMRQILKYKGGSGDVAIPDGIVTDNNGNGFIPDSLITDKNILVIMEV